MRHRVYGNQLGRNTKQARSLYRSLLLEIFEHGRVETTLAKARAIRPDVDKIITLAKRKSLAARRQILKILGRDLDLKKSFSDRHSGYGRVIRLGKRSSDATEKVIFELIYDQVKEDNPRETRA